MATRSSAEAPVEAVLWKLIFELIPYINDHGGEIDEFDPLSPTESDLIVPINSQLNTNGTQTHPNFNAGKIFPYTTHSIIPGLGIPGETDSALIHLHVTELLSVFPLPLFNSQWTLGQ